MNDYDDSEDYSSANCFRARSNTWPLNRPDLAVPSGICIDETLPEIDVEEDDLFTTNENWAAGVFDHDIMSWDPILNAQCNHQQPHHVHQHQQHTAHDHQQQATTIHHHHHHQPHPQAHQQRQLQQTIQQTTHEALLTDPSIIGAQVQQQTAPLSTQQLTPQHLQTLNSTHCLDSDGPNDYHIQQLHHLHLDGGQTVADHQTHYISPLSSSICIQGSTANLGNDRYISSDHQQHHHLQPLTSARYDLEQQNDLDAKAHDNDHHQTQQHHQQNQQMQQFHHLTSTSLDHNQSNSHMLSSSLATSGIGLSTDLEDLDYKGIDPSSLLPNSQLDDELSITEHQQLQQGDNIGNGIKQTSSTTSSKTKQNTPRRNAWGNLSYADLISQAINSTNDKRLTLSQIYDWMVQHVPYFKDKGDSNSSAGWKNSVRHNLSLHNRFKRLQNEGTGKSSWWTINPEANVGKCARRRAASMEASKYEKKRGRAKKRAEAIRQGLISYPSLTTNSSLNGSTSNLDQQQPQHHQSTNQFGAGPQQPQSQQTDELNSDNLQTRQPNAGLYSASKEVQYEENDSKIRLHQPRSQSPPTTTPPPQAVLTQQTQQNPQQTQEQQQQVQQPQPQHQQQLQVHHQMQKMEQHENDSYYIQQHHELHPHDQIHHQNQQILSPSDHMDLFGRHAIYMSEPCNDCNCTELINCGTNAMSFT